MHIFHKWSLWVPYEKTGRRWTNGVFVDFAEVWQRRTCVKCGRLQDNFVRIGPMCDRQTRRAPK